MSISTFDLADVNDSLSAADEPDTTNPESPNELETWADKQLARGKGPLNAIVFDLESGSRPWEEIECFYQPPVAMPPWNESMVKYGNAKKEELREQKRQTHKKAYEIQLANQTATSAADKATWIDKAALSPVTGRVLLIGFVIDGQYDSLGQVKSEPEALAAFWDLVDMALIDKTPLIGHNSNGFDLPFLVRRSWCLGVSVPHDVRHGRYWNPLLRDTMEEWGLGKREFVSLNTLGQFFGVGQKTEGVEGKDFSKLWFGEMPAEQWGTPEEQRAKAIEYSEQDVRLTAAIAAKMGMM